MAKKTKARRRKPAGKKKRKPVFRGRAGRARRLRLALRSLRGPDSLEPPATPALRGLGARSAGQSGDIQGLSRAHFGDSESVEELTEEGQDYEAEVVSGIENALDPDQGRVRTRRYIPPEER